MAKETFPTDKINLDIEPIWFKRTYRPVGHNGPKFPPDADIDAWLKHNAPTTFNELVDIRYCLYHQCSRGHFIVTKRLGDQFTLVGRHGALRVISNQARRYLLWKLRRSGKEKGWIGALPRTRRPRAKRNH